MAERTFQGPDGVHWQVWNVDPAGQADWPANARRQLPAHLTAGWLVFESATEKRRLQPVPPRWDAGTDEELWAHCLAAEPVRRRTPAPAG